MSFLAFLVSGAWIPDSSRTSWIPHCTKQKISRVPEYGFPLAKREKESLILTAISVGPRNHPTTGVPHAGVPAIVSEKPVS